MMTQTGHNDVLGGGGFHHVAINARDFDRSVRFYQEVLGCTTKIAWGGDGEKRCIMLDTGDGNYLELFERPDLPEPPEESQINNHAGIVHLAFRTTDAAGVLERARQAGATVEIEPRDVNIQTTQGPGPVPVRLAFFRGPDGEVIELFENALT